MIGAGLKPAPILQEMNMKKAFVFVLLVCFTCVAKAQETLTLAVSGGGVVFDLNGNGSGSPSVTLTWSVNGSAGEHAWIVYPYFSTSAALTGAHGHSIRTSAVSLAVDGGTAAPCNGTGIVGSYSNSLSASNNCPAMFYNDNPSLTFPTVPLSGTQTSTLTLAIAGAGGFNADSYTGTLNLIAYVE